jgi:hypothetical protein
MEGPIVLPISPGHALSVLDTAALVPLVGGAVWLHAGLVVRRRRLGEAIIYVTDLADGTIIQRKQASGQGDDEVLLESSEVQTPTSISRDGRWLIHTVAKPATRLDIWVLPLDGDREPSAGRHAAGRARRPAVGRAGRAGSDNGLWGAGSDKGPSVNRRAFIRLIVCGAGGSGRVG